MNNKEFIAELSRKSGFKIEDTQNMVRTSVYNIIDRLTDGDSVSISGLGTFEVKKRMVSRFFSKSAMVVLFRWISSASCPN